MFVLNKFQSDKDKQIVKISIWPQMSHAKILSTNDNNVDEAIGKLENEIVHPHPFACGWLEGVIWQHRNSVNFVFDLPNAIAEQELSKGRHLSSALALAPDKGKWSLSFSPSLSLSGWRMWLHRLGLYLSLTFQVSNVKFCLQLVRPPTQLARHKRR